MIERSDGRLSNRYALNNTATQMAVLNTATHMAALKSPTLPNRAPQHCQIQHPTLPYAGSLKAKRKAKRTQKGEKELLPPVAARGVKKARKRLAAEARIKPEAEPNRDAGTAEAFGRFMAVYPRQDAKEPARKEFARAVIDTDPEIIIAKAKVYALTEQMRLSRPGQTAQHTAMAKTWLHEQRWNDPYPEGVIRDNETGDIVAIEQEEEDGGEEAETFGRSWEADMVTKAVTSSCRARRSLTATTPTPLRS